MIYILFNGKPKSIKKTLSRPPHSKLKKIQGLFKYLHRNLKIFQGKMKFKDFSRLCKPCFFLFSIHGKVKKTMQEFFVVDFQGYTPRKAERSPVL